MRFLRVNIGLNIHKRGRSHFDAKLPAVIFAEILAYALGPVVLKLVNFAAKMLA